MKINPDDLPDVECVCGNKTFTQGKTIKKMSEVHPVNTTGKVQYHSMAVSVCLKCFEPLPLRP